MSDRIEQQIEIAAPVTQVWRALTDHEEFNTWFRVALAEPFAVGKTARGHITYPGWEHVVIEATVTAIEPERYFAYTWHPYAVDPDVDYSQEPQTLVEFRLEPIPSGTRVTVTESGFDRIPRHRRDEAYRKNHGGWASQLQNIAKHVTASS